MGQSAGAPYGLLPAAGALAGGPPAAGGWRGSGGARGCGSRASPWAVAAGAAAAAVGAAALAVRGLPGAGAPPAAAPRLDGPSQLYRTLYQRTRVGICGEHVPVPSLEQAEPPTQLHGEWAEACKKVAAPQSVPHWEGQNGCWEWMKLSRCNGEDDEVQWSEAQERAARINKAPRLTEANITPLRHYELCDHRHLGELEEPPSKYNLEADANWMRKDVSVFVLNAVEDTQRWSVMVRRLQELDIQFQRIWAVNLTHLHTYGDAASLVGAPVDGEPVLEAARRHKHLPADYDVAEAQNASLDLPGLGTRAAVLAAAGTAAGHLLALRQAASRAGDKPLVLLLEDDALLTSFFPTRLRSLLQETPCDWKALSLKSQCPHGACVSPHVMRVMPSKLDPQEGCRRGVNRGLRAVLYRREQLPEVSARLWSVVWQQQHPLCLNTDMALAALADEIPYYAVPAIQYPGFL